jgi:cytochrome b involved in lipid metabolism
MKKVLLITLFLISFTLLSFGKIFAYTADDVAQHNTEDDCWVIYDNGIYDITNYLDDHDRYLDIREWCGTDMTEAFETKDDTGRDHKDSSYALLETFKIGDIEEEIVAKTDDTGNSEEELISTDDTNKEESEDKISNPYNLWIPLLLSLTIYWGSYFIYGKPNLKKFNGFWNTVLLLSLLIPSLGFGIFMILRYSYPELWNINFDFMYWHVELSIVMGTLGISHLILRFKVYKLQLKKNS